MTPNALNAVLVAGSIDVRTPASRAYDASRDLDRNASNGRERPRGVRGVRGGGPRRWPAAGGV